MAASRAVTVKLNDVPEVAAAGAETEKCVAGPDTLIVPEPVTEDITVSVAVMVCEPVVLSVTEKILTPLVSVESAGNAPAPSLLVKCTVPT